MRSVPDQDGSWLLVRGRVVTPEAVLSPGWVRVTGDRIDALGPGLPPPGQDADLDVVHITGRDNGGQDLARLRQVTSDVGASWHELHDDDLVGALIEFARGMHVTQIVVGASQRGRWQELISGGSVVQRVSRQAARAGIDVHIVAPCEEMVP